MSCLTVKELKKSIKDLPDDMPVVRSYGDHAYYVFGNAGVVEAERLKPERFEAEYCEWFGPENSYNGEKAIIVKVLVLE